MRRRILVLAAAVVSLTMTAPMARASAGMCVSEGSPGCTIFNPCCSGSWCQVGVCVPIW